MATEFEVIDTDGLARTAYVGGDGVIRLKPLTEIVASPITDEAISAWRCPECGGAGDLTVTPNGDGTATYSVRCKVGCQTRPTDTISYLVGGFRV